MQKHDFGILSDSQVSTNMLEIFRKDTAAAEATDFAKILGTRNTYSVSHKNEIYYVTSDGSLEKPSLSNGFRPVIQFSKIANDIISRDHIRIPHNEWGTAAYTDYILEVEFGYYPQTVMSPSEQAELVKYRADGREWQTSNKFTYIEHAYCGCPGGHWQLDEYINPMGRFVRLSPTNNGSGSWDRLSDGRKPSEKYYYYIKVEPIKWLVDTRTGLAVSKNVLTYWTKSIDDCLNMFSEDVLNYQYDTSTYANDGGKNEEPAPVINQRTESVNNVLADIYKYVKYYHGKTNVVGKTKELISEYNKKIDGITPGKVTGLTFENNSPERLSMKLMSDLNDIFDGLKQNYENNKVYHDILESTDRCLAIIDGTNKNAKTDLEDDLITITYVIIPYLGNDDNKQKLKDIFLQIKKYVTELFESIDNLGDKINGKYNSVNDYEMDVRSKLQLFLLSIYNEIVSKETIKKINSDFRLIMDSNYEEANAVIAKAYLDEINELTIYIRKNGNDLEKKELDEIISSIDKNSDLKMICNYLAECIKKLYGIKLDIMHRLKVNQMKADYKIYARTK